VPVGQNGAYAVRSAVPVGRAHPSGWGAGHYLNDEGDNPYSPGPDDAREHIFDPFFTTKDVGLGTGLGLTTARRIVVDRHDGSLVVESEPGNTTFRVRRSPEPPLTGGG
jgi:hypothetical protein